MKPRTVIRYSMLNQESWRVLRGERKVEIAAAIKRERQRKKGSACRSTPLRTIRLFDRLRALRKRLADEGSVPPYVIFHDATLREMSHRRVTSLDEFATIPGVGAIEAHEIRRAVYA